MKKEMLLIFLFLAPSAAAQQFVLVSFNTLHYGWGNMTAAKDAAIHAVAQAANADAIVLQEIMSPNAHVNLQALLTPAVYDFLISQNNYGVGNYREYYLIILKKAKFNNRARREYPQLAAPLGPFSRPPMLVSVQPTGSNTTYYIGDFHAIWGRNQAQRRAEAAAICASLRPLVNSANIALAGDWNLTAVQVNAAAAACLQDIGPIGLTTLNRAGTQYSSSYDHAMQFVGGQLVLAQSNVYQPADTITWRRNVSDHVPVYVTYNYQ